MLGEYKTVSGLIAEIDREMVQMAFDGNPRTHSYEGHVIYDGAIITVSWRPQDNDGKLRAYKCRATPGTGPVPLPGLDIDMTQYPNMVNKVSVVDFDPFEEEKAPKASDPSDTYSYKVEHTYTDIDGADQLSPTKCECGADAVSAPYHSQWCPKA